MAERFHSNSNVMNRVIVALIGLLLASQSWSLSCSRSRQDLSTRAGQSDNVFVVRILQTNYAPGTKHNNQRSTFDVLEILKGDASTYDYIWSTAYKSLYDSDSDVIESGARPISTGSVYIVTANADEMLIYGPCVQTVELLTISRRELESTVGAL